MAKRSLAGCGHAEGGRAWSCRRWELLRVFAEELKNKDPRYGDAPVEHVFCHHSFGEKGRGLKNQTVFCHCHGL